MPLSGRSVSIGISFGMNVRTFELRSLDDVFECVIECLDYQEKTRGPQEFSFNFMIYVFEAYERWARG